MASIPSSLFCRRNGRRLPFNRPKLPAVFRARPANCLAKEGKGLADQGKNTSSLDESRSLRNLRPSRPAGMTTFLRNAQYPNFLHMLPLQGVPIG